MNSLSTIPRRNARPLPVARQGRSPLPRALRLLTHAERLRSVAQAVSNPRLALGLAAASEALQHAAGGDQEAKRDAARDAKFWMRSIR